MDGKSFRNLVEAYSEVYQEIEQLDEGRWSSLSALSRESQKRKEDKERGRPETEAETHGRLKLGKFRIGASKEERAEGGRERLKDRDKVPKKDGKDMFEHVLEYLVAEGYADTNKAAIAIMANMSEEWRESILEGMDPSKTQAAKDQATKSAVDFFTKPRKSLPPYEARKPRVGALTVPDFDLGTKKPKPKSPVITRDDGRTERPKPTEKPKAKPPAAPAPAKPKATPAPAPEKKAPTPTASPKPTEPPKAETPKPSGGEVAGSKIGDKSDYSVAATAKMSDRTKTILGTKDSETGKTIRKAQFGSLSPRERQGLG